MEWDLSQLPKGTREAVDDIFRNDFDLKILQAMKRQVRMKALADLNRPLARDDFGPKTFQIDTVFDAFWRRAYGHNYTEDEELMKFLAKRNPEITVRSRGTKEIQVGWMPGAASAKSKFHRKY